MHAYYWTDSVSVIQQGVRLHNDVTYIRPFNAGTYPDVKPVHISGEKRDVVLLLPSSDPGTVLIRDEWPPYAVIHGGVTGVSARKTLWHVAQPRTILRVKAQASDAVLYQFIPGGRPPSTLDEEGVIEALFGCSAISFSEATVRILRDSPLVGTAIHEAIDHLLALPKDLYQRCVTA